MGAYLSAGKRAVEMNIKTVIKNKTEELLINEFCCSSDELNGKSTVFSINFNAKQPYIKILAYRNCVVVCTSEDLHSKMLICVACSNERTPRTMMAITDRGGYSAC